MALSTGRTPWASPEIISKLSKNGAETNERQFGDAIRIAIGPDRNMLCVNAVSGCTGAARSYGWTSFDRVASITQGAGGASLAGACPPAARRADRGDPEHNRGALTDAGTGNTTWYFRNPAAASASELLSGATSTWRDYLVAYGEIVAERFNTGGTPLVYYFVGDHLASTTALTDANEARKEYDSYDAWGKRRYASGTDASGCNSMHPTSLTLRGFTAQEEMDSYCLVNLNARLYDPSIGRMLSADPTAPDPMSGQSFNRYSYVINNPLALVDPTGFTEQAGCPGNPTACQRIKCTECGNNGNTNGDNNGNGDNTDSSDNSINDNGGNDINGGEGGSGSGDGSGFGDDGAGDGSGGSEGQNSGAMNDAFAEWGAAALGEGILIARFGAGPVILLEGVFFSTPAY